MRRLLILIPTLILLLSCSKQRNGAATTPSFSISSSVSYSVIVQPLQSGTIQLQKNNVRVNLKTESSFRENFIATSIYSPIWTFTTPPSQSQVTLNFAGYSSEDSLRQAFSRRGCNELTQLEQAAKATPDDNSLFSRLNSLQMTCVGIQSSENFYDEKIAMTQRKSTFQRKWIVRNRGGSDVELTLKNFHDIPYYVITEAKGGDCGWDRRYETFFGNTRITLELNAGTVTPCKRIPDEEVDKVFDDLNVSITSTN